MTARMVTDKSLSMQRLFGDMDKHTLMHCVVGMIADRPDITRQDIVVLNLRLDALKPVSETPRPERK